MDDRYQYRIDYGYDSIRGIEYLLEIVVDSINCARNCAAEAHRWYDLGEDARGMKHAADINNELSKIEKEVKKLIDEI